jgi:WD40 repeat protein
MRRGLLILAAGVVMLAPVTGQQADDQEPTGKELACLKGHTGEVSCVAFSPDGRTLASGSADNTIKLWDVATSKERATLRGHALTHLQHRDSASIALTGT